MNSLHDLESVSNNTNNFNFKKEIFKYLYFWKYFIISIVVFLLIGFLNLRYSKKTYTSTAKIKIIDKSKSSFELPSGTDIFNTSKINLENELEIIKSAPILSQVVKNLNLNISVYSIGDVMESLLDDYPFEVMLTTSSDSISNLNYRLNVSEAGFEIFNVNNQQTKYKFKDFSTFGISHDLPFEIHNFKKNKFKAVFNKSYSIKIQSNNQTISYLKNNLTTKRIGKSSDIIALSITSHNPVIASKILNNLVEVFNNDGVKDRQLIHKRTIEFVNERYAYLSLELDSIEVKKQIFKINNDLVDLTTNSAISLEQSFKSEESIFSIENQISITNLLINTLDNSELELLPANMGVDNSEINSLISEYNLNILDRKKLVLSAGSNNPSIKQMDNLISDTRSNIIFSLKNHLLQLNNLKEKLSKQFYKFDSQVSNLPEKEKILRSIERNQQIKESLYLFLLQKREEAEVSYAVTEPSIKVVEFAIPNKNPISPKSSIIYSGSFIVGLLLPFGVLFLLFLSRSKIYTKDDLLELNIGAPIIAEIPEITEEANKIIQSSSERTLLAESFRVLTTNLQFLVPKEKVDKCKVFITTSTIKGEGKTFTALNLAFTYSTLNKKVLLIGADLHNPQIHKYLDIDKTYVGLSNFLSDNSFNWKDAIINISNGIGCDILLGGSLPPNPAQLLNNGSFDSLIEEAKQIYDYVIIDTPPSLLVSDTLSISHLSDLVVFVTRSNHTKREVLNFLKDALLENKFNNLGIILNGLGANSALGYSYANSYKYGYHYNYSYNYGYGYGYETDDTD